MKMKELFAKPGTWCQGVFARDAQGRQSSLSGNPPVSFCLQGAVYECYPPEQYQQVLDKISNHIPSGYATIAGWNDAWNRKQSEVQQFCEEIDI